MDEDFIDGAKAEWRLRYKRELTPNDAADLFTLHNFEARIGHLKRLKAPDAMSPRQASDRLVMERAIRSAHERLRKVGR
jgi:hypothetical protein